EARDRALPRRRRSAGLHGSGPAAAEGLVDLDQGHELVVARARGGDLRGEELALGVEGLEVRADAAVVPELGQAYRLVIGGGLGLLLEDLLAVLPVRDQR